MSDQEPGGPASQLAWTRASHALREPLMAISGFAQALARRHADDGATAELTERIVEAVAVMERVVEEGLTYTALEFWTIAPKQIETEALVRREIERARVAIDRVGAEVEVGPLPSIVADRVAIAALFRMLIDLAVGRAPRAAAKVSISSRRNDDGWMFTVGSDLPMVDGDASDPFAMFGRRSGAGEWSSDLAICRRVVDLHGGRIWVDRGKGAAALSFELLDQGQTSPSA